MRTTNELKDNIIRVRVSEDMREYLEREAKLKDESVSLYIRELIEADRGRSKTKRVFGKPTSKK